MTWADVAAKNAPAPEDQPKPDPSLLEGDQVSDDSDLSHSTAHDEKVHIVTREEFETDTHPATTLDASAPSFQPKRFTEADAPSTAPPARDLPSNQTRAHGHQVSKDVEEAKKTAADAEKNAEQKAEQVGKDVKQGAAKAERNVEEQAAAAEKNVKQGAAVAEKNVKEGAAIAEKTIKQGAAVAEKKYEQGKEVAGKKYEEGKEAAQREYQELSEKAKTSYNKLSKEAKDDWHKLSKESKKQWEAAKNSEAGQELQKPEVWGSLLGVANLAVLGSLAYFSYVNWGKPRWDRRVVSATVIGASTWFGLQGYLLPQTDAVNQRRH